jgi:lipopolysaccharide export system permease protein
MRFGVLTRYLAYRFTSALILILLGVVSTMVLIDFIEQMRRFSDRAAFTPAMAVHLALLRAPDLFERILPFLLLFAAMVSLLNLSRRLELVVARATGVSVWGFLAAPIAIALMIGVVSSLAINPIASRLKDKADRIQAEVVRGADDRTEGVWFRQSGIDGPSIIHASKIGEDGLTLHGITAFVFGTDGRFREKVSARQAVYADGVWTLKDAAAVSADGAPRASDRYLLATSLSADELRQTLITPQAYSLWTLPAFIEAAERLGLNSDRFRLTYHTLLSRPFLLAAMVAIAATVSLRLFRYGGIGRLVLMGIGAGFLLYVVTEIMNDLGSNGIVSPALAAWAPAIVALTFGATLLLYQEDG